jgi:hypothetical protein
MTNEKPEQPNLFGDAEEVFNALESAAQKSIDRKQKEIKQLSERQQKLSHAIVLVRKARKVAEPAPASA